MEIADKMTSPINVKVAIPAIIFLLCSISMGWSAETMDTWPAGWKQTYLRFQNFITTRKQHWPSSGLVVDKQSRVLYKNPDFIAPKKGGYVVYEYGTQIREGRNHGTPLTQTFTKGTYTLYYKSVTELSYQYFPPLLRIKISEDANGVKTTKTLDTKDELNYWPNSRGLLFIDFNTLSSRLAHNIYIHNYKTNPSILLQVDHQANLRRKKLDSPDAERLLHWRIYHNGILKESGPAKDITLKSSTYGVGSYLAFLAIEGPDGFMPVSNFAEYYIHPIEYRAPNSLIRHKKAPVQEIYRCGCNRSHFRDKSWLFEEEDKKEKQPSYPFELRDLKIDSLR